MARQNSARQPMAGTRPCLLVLLLLLLTLSTDVVQSKYANGARRSGKKLVGQPALEERHVNSLIQCLTVCDGVASCNALNFGTMSSNVNCQLFEENACQGHQLVADPAVDYYDVYDQQVAELQLSYWDDPSCTQDGYCSASCSAQAAGDFCGSKLQCGSSALTPPGAYHCVNHTCQPRDGFWEVRPGFSLPTMMDWRMEPFYRTAKKLKTNTCTLDISLKLGIGAKAELSAGTAGTRMIFVAGIGSTDLYYSVSWAFENDRALVTGVNTAGMVNTDSYSRLKVSWCGGAMAIGPEDNPTLVTAQAGITDLMEYVIVYSNHNESWLRVDSGVADPWLFDEAGTGPDPVFEISSFDWSPTTNTLLSRMIAPSVDVTVKYDCMTENNCHVFFTTGSPLHRLKVCVGAYDNDAYQLVYEESGVDNEGMLETMSSRPILNATEFNTFTVRYNNGHVTVFRNDDTEPAYNVTAPRLLSPITSVGIGSWYTDRKVVRVARYDPGWRTDTWRTLGTGFSNMALEVYSP